MRNFFICLVFLLFIQQAYAQNRFIDSIHAKLSEIKIDTQRVGAYADLCFYYRYVNIDSAIYYGNKSYELAVATKFQRGQAGALNNLGLAYREYGDLSKSLELQFKSLKICNDNGYIAERGLCYRRIGLIYMDLNNYGPALEYHLKAVQDNLKAGDKRNLAITYQNLSRIYLGLNQVDSSRYYIQEAFLWKNETIDLMPDFYGHLIKLEHSVGNDQKAYEAYLEGVKWATEFNDFRNLCHLNYDIAKVYYDRGKLDSALFFAEKSVKFGEKINFKLGLYRTYTFLAAYFDQSDPAKAFFYLKSANKAKESLFGAGNMQLLQNLVFRENQRQSDLRSAEKAYEDKLKIYGLSAGLLFILIVAGFLFRTSASQRKVNTQLSKQKKDLEEALQQLKSTQSQLVQSEKMASLGELTAGIAHEIQNPLNFVNNFSEVSKELIDELKIERAKVSIERDEGLEDELLSDISQNLEKITHHGKRADAIVKGMLQHSRSSTGQKELADINALCDEYLRLSYHGLRAKDSIFNAAHETHFDTTVGAIKIVPQEIGRVLLNLLNNAFYAVNEKSRKGIAGYTPKVAVRTEKVGESVKIEVEDNGMGIPDSILEKIFQPFFTTKPTGQGTGLGLSLSYDIVKAHGGELTANSQVGEGTVFKIILPIV